MKNKISATGKEAICCVIFFVAITVIAIAFMQNYAKGVDRATLQASLEQTQ